MNNYSWLLCVAGTFLCWGLYGVFLHSGQEAMQDKDVGRYKAFFWVGIAYVLIAVLAPAAILFFKGSSWQMPGKGVGLSLFAGSLGALGAFGVLVAFALGGKPPVVMSIVFAFAPIVNAVASFMLHPPAGGFGSIRWQFYVGILLAAVGATLVTLFKPGPTPPKKASAVVEAPRGSGT